METIIKQGDKEVKAINLVPELSNRLAIVDFDTLQRITRSLDRANFREIKEQFINELQATDNLKDMVEVGRKEVNFHMTVNLISEYKPEEPKAEEPVAANAQEEQH